MLKTPKILLILSCGKRKAKELRFRKLQASKAYTGPMFQVVNKAQREGNWGSNIFLGIVSAKYGFLRNSDPIEYYDRQMTKEIAKKYNSDVIQGIAKWNEEEKFDLIYVLMGKVYLKAVEGLETHVNAEVKVENMGGLGVGQQKLVRFLERISGKTPSLHEYL